MSSRGSSRVILRVILTSAALLQIYSYIFVVFYSLVAGTIDFAWPIKLAFASALLFVIIRAAIDFSTAWKNRHADRSELGLKTYALLGDAISVVALATAGYFFWIRPIAPVNLTSVGLPWEVAALIILGMGLSLGFTIIAVQSLIDLLRERRVPVILSQSNDQRRTGETS